MTTRREQKQQAQIQQKKPINKNKVYWTAASVLAIGTLGISIAVLHQYSSSLNWSDANSTSIPLAKQSIDMLYDKSSQSKKYKTEFINLYHDIINADGSLNKTNASPMNIAKLKSIYKKFNASSDPSNYQRKYGEVLLKYSIQEQFDNLFTDDSETSLESNVTPMQVAKLNNSTYSDLSSLYTQNPKDAFVENIINLEKDLNKDIQTLNDVASKFNKAFNINDNSVTLNTGYHDDITSQYNNDMNSLKYNWESTKYIQHIVSVMKPIVNWTISQYNNYAIYINDLKAKNTAFNNWKQEQKQFFAQVDEIHKAAIKAKQDADNAKKNKQARQDKLDYTAGEKAGKQDAMNSIVTKNFKGKSDAYKQGYTDGYKNYQSSQSSSSSSSASSSSSSQQTSSSSNSSSINF